MKLKYVFIFLVVLFIKFTIFDSSSKTETSEIRCMKDYSVFLNGDYKEKLIKLLDIGLNINDYSINQMLASLDALVALQESVDLSQCPVKLRNSAEELHLLFDDKATLFLRIKNGEAVKIDPDAAYHEQEKIKKIVSNIKAVFDEHF